MVRRVRGIDVLRRSLTVPWAVPGQLVHAAATSAVDRVIALLRRGTYMLAVLREVQISKGPTMRRSALTVFVLAVLAVFPASAAAVPTITGDPAFSSW